MRATAIPAPIRKGKPRLLESCAIAAGMVALALGGPARAQVAGSGQVVVGPGLSGATISPPSVGAPPNTTNVTTTGAQTIIDWTPSDTGTGPAPIDFLPAGNTLNFFGAGQYTVLNRFVNGAGGSLSRQIALNGTVNGYVNAASPLQGGNIWFYNAGGILIGSTGVINVGSLVLSANAIDTADGLFGADGAIRFRGVTGTSAVEIAADATINAQTIGNPGGSYVAMVAPRVVQRGTVRTDGSTAYVAAEQADIRINNGLFDINVLVGAENGDVITHSGITTGPAHQQGDGDQSRVYMVAIPKNDAVTMLVSGQVGYEDALSAQSDPDGAVRLSAGYNIVNGEFAGAPVHAGGNITVNDVVFRSNVITHASDAFVGQPLSQLPPVLPDTPSPPGNIVVQGNGTFIGDASASITVNANRSVSATGNLIIQSGGANGTPGMTTVTVDGGRFAAGGNLSIRANGTIDAVTGDSRAGTASLAVSNGGTTAAVGTVSVTANGMPGRDTTGAGGDGFGGNASITVTGVNPATGVASQVTGNSVTVQATGGGFEGDAGVFTPPDQGGNGTGGTATISILDGGALMAANGSVVATANGFGLIGNIQSGNGTGGTARIEIAGANSRLNAATTTISANGIGGGSISDPIIGTFPSQNGGDGRGGFSTFSIGGDTTTAVNPGDTSLSVFGSGGNAGGAENTAGGDAFGGTATVEATGLVTTQFASLTVNADALGGGASSPSLLTGFSGNATGGTINLTADNGAVLNANSDLVLSATGQVVFGENLGSGRGGNVTVSAEDEGAIGAPNTLAVDVSGGSFSNGIAQSAGNGTGGNVNLLAARNGTLTAARYDIHATAATSNVRGTSGPAQGGFVNLAATAGGQISGTDISLGSTIDTSARSGVSAGGSVAGGGTIRLAAEGGGVELGGTTFVFSSGISGGALASGSSTTGIGGVIQVQVAADPLDASTIRLDRLQGGADGRTVVDIEAAPGIEKSSGDGQGGTLAIDVAGGTFSANSINISAAGFGGIAGPGVAAGTGRGGAASYLQTGGTAAVGDMAITANGFGGTAADVSGQGLGGRATIDLLGGTLTGADVIAQAVGVGGSGAPGDNFDPGNVVPSGNGGEGQGGTATININGPVTVNTSSLTAFATGSGGTGGEFSAGFGGLPQAGGDGGGGIGGTGAINVTSGAVTASSIRVDATGIGGEGGNVFGSSSSGVPVGVGIGGDGGEGRGGNATIDFATTATAGTVSSEAAGIGGNGGSGYSGGTGGLGAGGLAQVIVTGFDAGTLAVTVDTSAFGGSGGDGQNGTGGNGGDGRGGTGHIEAAGSTANATVGQANFITDGTGGAGGSGGIPLGATPAIAPRGGDGGTGEGGILEVVASNGATVALGPDPASGTVMLGSRGIGGGGGTGSNAGFPNGSQGGDGGQGGGAIGGTVHLFADGGTVTSNGNPVNITVGGTAGAGGSGGNGTGTGAPGAGGSNNGTTGGRVDIEALGTLTAAGQVSFGDTVIAANGDSAGRIQMRADGNIMMASLTAEALGLAPLTNLDTDTANTGIFMGVYGGAITTGGAVSLTTGSSVGVYAQAGGTLAAGGNLTIQAGDEVDIRHDFRTGTAPTISSGGALAITAASGIRAQPGSLLGAATSLSLNTTAANGSVNVDALDAATSTQVGAVNFARIGSTTSGTDLTVDAFGIEIGNASVGDDINLTGNFLTLGTLNTDGTGLDTGLDGSNIVLSSVAATTVTHGEADNDFTANVGNFQTGLNSIITGGDIDITSPGAIDLGNSTAGGFVSVDGQSIAFANIDAGTTVGLNATGTVPGAAGISGGGIVAGGTVTLDGLGIAITGSVQTTTALFATSTGGNVSIASAEADGAVGITADGNISGSYAGGGNIVLNATGNITASVVSTGGYVNPLDLVTPPAEGFALIDAGGNVTLTNSSAATMLGVHAGQAASVSNATAGEDMFVQGGTTAALTAVSAGDDLTVSAPAGITANGASTTGAGPDNRTLFYGPSAGGDVFQVSTSAADLSNIDLSATAGNIGGSDIDAFDNLTATASGTVITTGLLHSGLATTIRGSSLSFGAITAGTDIDLNATAGGIAATGALSAGEDFTAGATGAARFAGLVAGDDIRIVAGGAVGIATAQANATGNDDDFDGSSVMIDTPGNIDVTGATTATGQVRWTAGGTIDGGPISGIFASIDAVGAINLNGAISAAQGMLVEGSQVTFQDATSTNGQIVLRATNGGVSSAGDTTAAGSIQVEATGAVALTGTTDAGSFLEASGSQLAIGDVNAGSFVVLTSTSGAITAPGLIDAGGDIAISAAADGQFNSLIAGDDIGINAGGAVTVATMRANGTNPQGEEVGSNVTGTITGAFTVTGDTFSADDILLNAASIAMRGIEAGESLTATSSGGPITLASADVGGNIALTSARAVTVTGELESGLATTVRGLSMNLQSITAGTDIVLTATTGSIASTGALAAGHDVTIGAAGNINISELDAGDDILADAGGTAQIGAAYSYGTGADNETNGSNIGVTAGGALTFTGIAQSTGNTVLRGAGISTQVVAAGGNVGLTATTGDIVSNDDVTGFNIVFDAVGDIGHDANSLLRATNQISLTADGNIAIGNARAADNMTLDAGGTIDANALSSGRLMRLLAGGAVELSGGASATVGILIEGSTIELNDIGVQGGNFSAVASNGGVHATGLINTTGGVTAIASQAVDMTGDITAATTVNLSGASVNVGNVTADLGNISLTATNGAVNAPGTIDAGRDINIATTGGGTLGRLIAGDDIGITGRGDVGIAFMNATGTNPAVGEEVGSNVGITIAGDVVVEHGEAADDYVVDAASFRTGLNSIIAGGDIDITTAGASDLGNSTAGGSITIDAQSIAFNTLDAGTTIDLTANGTAAGAEGIDGATIAAGSNINLNGNSIAITDAVTGDASFFATGTGGPVAVNRADVDGSISIFASGDLTGTYVSGGDIRLNSDANITASANANGGYSEPFGNGPTEGNLFVIAMGDITLTNSGAARMFGVNAGQAASITIGTAGEDLLVVAGSTANLAGLTAGDDLEVRATGAISARNVRTTGTGADTHALNYLPANGFTIGAGEGVSGTNGADIVMASANGAINAGALSAGDDILLNAATRLVLDGATTLGLGATGGDSSIRTQSANATLGNLDAADDIFVSATRAVTVTAPANAGRDIAITAASADLASLMNPAGGAVNALDAGRDLSIATRGGAAGGTIAAGRNLTIVARGNVMLDGTVAGSSISLTGDTGVSVGSLVSGTTTSLASANGDVAIDSLFSGDAIDVDANAIVIGGGNLVFSSLVADTGDAVVEAGGELFVTSGNVAGDARFSNSGERLGIANLTAGNVELTANNGFMALTNVSADGNLAATARGSLLVDGVVTGRAVSVTSGDIAIGSTGRIGTAGITETLQIANGDARSQTFIGGTGAQSGYHIDSDELTRVYGGDIRIAAPVVDRSAARFIGTVPPDVVIDDFTMTAGTASSNLGPNGSLTIETPGTVRVVGDAALTGMSDDNALNIFARQSLEVIMGGGSIRLTGGSNAAPAGQLNLASDDVIVATLAAIDDVAAATTTAQVEDRLARNDGVLNDDGALFAGGIQADVIGGFYVQNSGGGSDYGERRGLTFGALGLNVLTEGASRIVVNGVHLGPAGPVTGLDTIALLTIGGAPANGASGNFDPRSTFNGCLIAATGACAVIPPPPPPQVEIGFPVQDVIEEEVNGDDGDGNTLPTPLITMRDLDPLSGEPLLDDPVTGAGNDDLWIPPHD